MGGPLWMASGIVDGVGGWNPPYRGVVRHRGRTLQWYHKIRYPGL